jgi:hypothetical protein
LLLRPPSRELRTGRVVRPFAALCDGTLAFL